MYRLHNPNLVAKTRKWFFAGLAVAGLAVMAAGLWMAASQMRGIAELQSRIARVAALPDTSAAAQATFLAAESPNIAQTRLQTQIQEIAAAHALEVEVIRSAEIEDQGRTLALGIVLNGVIPEANLAGFLTALETASPVIMVNTLDLRRARATSRRDPTRNLALRLGLTGLMLK